MNYKLSFILHPSSLIPNPSSKMIVISRSDLERSIPVATSKDDNIFDLLSPAIAAEAECVSNSILGSVGLDAYDDAANVALVAITKKVVCLRAFTRQFRQLDLVLTATGFGVVSTQDLAPASKMRTDALISQLHVDLMRSEAVLIKMLFAIPTWWNTPQRVGCVPTLFWNIDLLERYGGRETVTINDWRLAQPVILAADNFLRSRLSAALMDELLAVHAGKPTDSDRRPIIEVIVIPAIQKYIGLCVAADHPAAREQYHQLMNSIEAHLDLFPEYANSDAYRANHYEGFQNTADSTAFFFQG